MKPETEDLYTVNDVKRVRELLTEEQDNRCAITMIELAPKQHCLDHNHDETQFVRGVAHRQANAALGRIENLYTRYLSYWYPGKLSDFLRQCAAYLEKDPDSRYRHNGWIKKVQTLFNSLSEGQKGSVLKELGLQGVNSKERKELFKKAVLSREYSYETLRGYCLEAKNS